MEATTKKALTPTESITELLKQPEIDPAELKVANMYLKKFSIEEIAQYFDTSEATIVSTLESKDCKKYINSRLLHSGYLNDVVRYDELNKLAADAFESGSTKEKLDVSKHLEEINNNKTKREAAGGPAVQINMNLSSYQEKLAKLAVEMAEGGQTVDAVEIK